MTRLFFTLSFVTLVACGPQTPAGDGGWEEEDAGELLDGGDGGGAAGGEGGSEGGGAGAGGTGGEGGSDGGTGPQLVTVSHPRELRGVWVATVNRIDWPPALNLTEDAGVASLQTLVDHAAEAGLNALFFQVRPYADALYESQLDPPEPWSRFLSGTQGTGIGWDPLAALIPLAHSRGIEVHAWINPYRGTVASLAQHSITYDNIPVMNPGVPEVRAHVVAVIDDILSHYDVDGVHFDDYFYPYPAADPYPDDSTYAAYTGDGGTMNKADWRRDNVNRLVADVMALVRSDHPTVRFGIGPFGIWKSGHPSTVTGLSAYDAISCDAVAWLENESIDYLAPQLYWSETSAQQKFSHLTNWWAMQLNGRHLFPGHAVYRLRPPDVGHDWPLAEIEGQIEYARTKRADGVQGAVHFRMSEVRDNTKGLKTLFGETLYKVKAFPPPLPRAEAVVAPAVPFVQLDGDTLQVGHPVPATVRAYLLYRQLSPGEWELAEVSGLPVTDFTVSSGTWAVSAIGRGGGESQGVRVVVP